MVAKLFVVDDSLFDDSFLTIPPGVKEAAVQLQPAVTRTTIRRSS